MFVFKNPQFIKSAKATKGFPTVNDSGGRPLPEIAVAGRSNVGKSSLLNHLFQTKKLVKTSANPGKTQLLNFFTLNEALMFVDLPGYGYANVPTNIRKEWGPMVHNYLETRKQLKLLLFLFDIRRLPNQEDLQLLEWASANELATILVLTKVDKVTRNVRNKNTDMILEGFATENLHHVHYSVPKNIGRKELVEMINDALQEEL